MKLLGEVRQLFLYYNDSLFLDYIYIQALHITNLCSLCSNLEPALNNFSKLKITATEIRGVDHLSLHLNSQSSLIDQY